MRNLWLLMMLWSSVAWAQGKPAHQSTANASPAAPSHVALNAPVLTIKGLCPPPKASQSSATTCETVVTREQFEKIVGAIQPKVDDYTKQQIGRAYPDFLILSSIAEQRGLENTTRFQERLAFARLQILSQELVRQIQLEAANVPDKDIEDYYKSHARDFETANLERIVIPLHGEKDSSPDSMKSEAEQLRARAVAGEDFGALQKEAYRAAAMNGNTEPDPSLPKMRRRSLPPSQASAFDLKPGEISAVISDATGYYIYKVNSRGTISLKEAHQEIWNILRQQRTAKMIESIHAPFTTEVNHDYFGAELPADRD